MSSRTLIRVAEKGTLSTVLQTYFNHWPRSLNLTYIWSTWTHIPNIHARGHFFQEIFRIHTHWTDCSTWTTKVIVLGKNNKNRHKATTARASILPIRQTERTWIMKFNDITPTESLELMSNTAASHSDIDSDTLSASAMCQPFVICCTWNSTVISETSSGTGAFLKREKQERYETSRRTIGRDDSYPVLGRSEP